MQVKYTVMGQKWAFKICSKKSFEKFSTTTEDAAVTDSANRIVHFNVDDFGVDVVLHELWHVYFTYTYTNSASLAALEVEEISAELFCNRGKEMLLLGHKIYDKLKEFKMDQESKDNTKPLRTNSKKYRDNYDRIFKKKESNECSDQQETKSSSEDENKSNQESSSKQASNSNS